MDKSGTAARQRAHEKGDEQGGDRGDLSHKGKPVCDARCGQRSPQGKRAVHGQIRKIQDFVGDVYAQRHDGVYQAFFQNTE